MRVRRAVERAWTDHESWLRTNDRARVAELHSVDERMNERNILGSGIHGTARQEVNDRFADSLTENQRETLRAIEDAFAELGPIERWWLRWRLRGDKLDPASVELRLRGEGTGQGGT